MTAIIELLFLLVLASGIGRSLFRLIGVNLESTLERFVFSTPVGLGAIAYVVLALGLVGLLSLGPIVTLLLLLAVLNYNGIVATLRDIASIKNLGRTGRPTAGTLVCSVILLSVGMIVLLNCFVPPGAHEWDALSYHLAAPKVYLQHHRIIFLPTDHHSNFPFTVEMLFTLGLLFNGYMLANLFHFVAGAICVGAIFAIARRHFTPGASQIGALVFATTPIVIWESGAAYIEMGLALFSLLAAGAVLRFRESQNPRWLAAAGVMMGFALSVKALALIPFAVIAALLLLEKAKFKNLRWYLAPAIVVGCPFYVKSWIWTGNPVYPYAYSVFGGKYWNAEMAAGYASEQRGFGQNGARTSVADDAAGVHPDWRRPDPLQRVTNALLVPFDLAGIPRIFYNYQDPGVHSHLGFLAVALPPLLVLRRGASGAAKWIAAVAGLWFLAWSQTMQYVRYLIPAVPFLGLAGAEGASRIARATPVLRAAVWAALLFQSALSFAHFIPTVPAQWERATDSEARERYLASQLNSYGSMKWLNEKSAANAGVVLYEEPRGFYLDRPYLWGNSPHSLYIPYPQFADGQEMADWFGVHGIRYALINLQFSQKLREPGASEQLFAAVRDGSIAKLALDWYTPKSRGEPWIHLLGDALHSGSAIVVPEACARATVVMEFRPRK